MQEGEVQCVKRFGVVDEKKAQEKDIPSDILKGLADEYAAIEDIEREKTYYRETIVRGMRVTPVMLRMSNAKEPERREQIYKQGIAELDPRLHLLFQTLQSTSRYAFKADWNAPLPILRSHVFGGRLDTRLLSTPELSTSELLRTL